MEKAEGTKAAAWRAMKMFKKIKGVGLKSAKDIKRSVWTTDIGKVLVSYIYSGIEGCNSDLRQNNNVILDMKVGVG